MPAAPDGFAICILHLPALWTRARERFDHREHPKAKAPRLCSLLPALIIWENCSRTNDSTHTYTHERSMHMAHSQMARNEESSTRNRQMHITKSNLTGKPEHKAIDEAREREREKKNDIHNLSCVYDVCFIWICVPHARRGEALLPFGTKLFFAYDYFKKTSKKKKMGFLPQFYTQTTRSRNVLMHFHLDLAANHTRIRLMYACDAQFWICRLVWFWTIKTPIFCTVVVECRAPVQQLKFDFFAAWLQIHRKLLLRSRARALFSFHIHRECICFTYFCYTFPSIEVMFLCFIFRFTSSFSLTSSFSCLHGFSFTVYPLQAMRFRSQNVEVEIVEILHRLRQLYIFCVYFSKLRTVRVPSVAFLCWKLIKFLCVFYSLSLLIGLDWDGIVMFCIWLLGNRFKWLKHCTEFNWNSFSNSNSNANRNRIRRT